jgi:hypothetical protein
MFLQISNLTYTAGGGPPVTDTQVLYSHVIAFTVDHGLSWNSTAYTFAQAGLDLAENYSAPTAPVGVFDKFGNFWWARGTLDPASLFYTMSLFVSTDGGANFVFVETLSFAAELYGIIDFDLRAGSSGVAGGYALYITGTLQQTALPFTNEIFLAYKLVTGLGQYTTPANGTILTSIQVAPDTSNSLLSQPQLIVGRHGVLSVIGRQASMLATPLIAANADCRYANFPTPTYITGTGNYGRLALYNLQNLSYFPVMDGPLSVFTSGLGNNNMLGYINTVYTPGKGVNFLSTRLLGFLVNAGIFAEAFADMAYDPTCHLLWVVYCDQKPLNLQGLFTNNTATSMSIYAISSHDDGRTWSNQKLISDSYDNARGLPTISIDPIYGIVSICFYDARADTHQRGDVQYFCVTFKSQLE